MLMRQTLRRSLLIALTSLPFVLPAAHADGPKAPPLPPVVALDVLPKALTLEDARDVRTFIVTGRTADGTLVDLSAVAKARPESPLVRVDEDGYVSPRKSGKTALVVTFGGKSVRLPVTVKGASDRPVSFVREVMPVLSRVGCSAGTCHGAAKGKNGFKLSLRGYDAAFDYHALVDDVAGRRFDRAAPSESLMLLKPTGAVPHKGGVLFKKGDRRYGLIERWIREGAASDVIKVGRVSRLEVLPRVPNLTLPGQTQKTVVIAHYPDGTTRDVTREAVFTSSVPETAGVSMKGELTALRRGEASLLVRYEGQYASSTMTVIGDRKGWKWAAQPQLNYIDRLIDAKLGKIKSLPAPICDDASFLRRAMLDLAGLPPTPEQVRAFLADKTPTQAKRAKLVDLLIGSPEFNDRWTNKWADLLSVNSKFLGESGARKFRAWIHDAVSRNVPYDQFVRSLLTASGDGYEVAPANFFRVNRSTETATENVTQLFLGVRFSCNKCHDHPFEKWTQGQYYQVGAFFARVGFKPGAQAGDETVFTKGDGEVLHPKTNLAVAPAVPVGRLQTAALRGASADRRDAFSDWLTSKENPFFSRAFVNRLWSYFLGRGIIDPVDDIRASNPPVNPELLEALNTEFVSGGFDVRKVMRTIVLSRTYQGDIKANRWNADDTTNFSHALPRRLEAEPLFDAISGATGVRSRFTGMPEGTRAVQLPDAGVPGGDGFLLLFGKPPRESPCECERTSNVSLGQALNLINGPTISDAIANPDGRLARLLKTNPKPEKVAEEVFLSVLCRMPTKKETANALAHFKRSATLQEGAQDLMWALINSPAFLFNR